jgi:adenylyltransferase/sulfurtransferase
MFDALDMTFRVFKVQKDPQCPVCGEHPTITELIDYEEFCSLPLDQRNGSVAKPAAATTPVPAGAESLTS